MEIDLSDKNLTTLERTEIKKLLKRKNNNLKTGLEQMWYLMDLVWDDFKCDNKNCNWDNIGRFYSHPVWLLNGLFIEQDKVSMQHRNAISDWIIKKNFKNIVDYGGGFGTLARLIAAKDKNMTIDIYEPHPSDFGLRRIREFNNINIVDKLDFNYDCLICTDVLEHLPDPMETFYKMIDRVRLGGYLVIVNSFSPVIKCHLPQNFHLRYTFNYFAKNLGLEVVGNLEGSHATILKKRTDDSPDWNKVRLLEILSIRLFSMIQFCKPVLKAIKRILLIK